MKKTVMIVAFGSFLLFMLAGYYLTVWMGERDKHMESMQAERTVQTNPLIGQKTKMIYQYFYTKDRVTKEHIELAPVFLQGLDMDQLKSIYTGWQIAYFSPEKVILRSVIEGLSTEAYVIGEMDGYLAVFYEDGMGGLRLKEKTDMPLSALPDGEIRQIREGIRVTGEENLVKLLSDYMS